MKPHFGYPMVCTKMWHFHFLSRRTLGLAPSLAEPWSTYISDRFSTLSAKRHKIQAKSTRFF